MISAVPTDGADILETRCSVMATPRTFRRISLGAMVLGVAMLAPATKTTDTGSAEAAAAVLGPPGPARGGFNWS